MSKCKVGDRVRVYCHFPFNGKIDGITDTGLLSVIEDGFYSAHGDAPFHPKQCRRLVKKERRRVWVAFDGAKGWANDQTCFYAYAERPTTETEWIEFVEVKPKREDVLPSNRTELNRGVKAR